MRFIKAGNIRRKILGEFPLVLKIHQFISNKTSPYISFHHNEPIITIRPQLPDHYVSTHSNTYNDVHQQQLWLCPYVLPHRQGKLCCGSYYRFVRICVHILCMDRTSVRSGTDSPHSLNLFHGLSLALV